MLTVCYCTHFGTPCTLHHTLLANHKSALIIYVVCASVAWHSLAHFAAPLRVERVGIKEVRVAWRAEDDAPPRPPEVNLLALLAVI